MAETVIISLIAGLATCFGALVVLMIGNPREKTLSALFGLAAGIMLAVIVLDLLPSALEQGTFRQTAAGFSIGIIVMLVLDLVLSQVYPPLKSNSNQTAYFRKMGYLVGIGIALHDLPEGIAIAAGFSAQQHLGLVIAVAIGLHNIPEGMATATPLKIGKVPDLTILLLNIVLSLFTPVGAIIGLLLLNLSPGHVALLLAVAAGAMTYIVKNELLPESRRRHPNYATLGGIIGFLFILVLGFVH
ncbi:ZIP family metal transporter [Phosphitispora fastidiosa]|uniref:ZIP family metal transporter n=1 Tax=Phosphitispora fastidiosa TaxID=2837202 RepID=UPI001E504E29|nr:ZIP family metal transporter [Phosphitispora fastidiosa]MBU7007760.1 ZIP family zinc transporter [Phosphitispora fastidiosa]